MCPITLTTLGVTAAALSASSAAAAGTAAAATAATVAATTAATAAATTAAVAGTTAAAGGLIGVSAGTSAAVAATAGTAAATTAATGAAAGGLIGTSAAVSGGAVAAGGAGAAGGGAAAGSGGLLATSLGTIPSAIPVIGGQTLTVAGALTEVSLVASAASAIHGSEEKKKQAAAQRKTQFQTAKDEARVQRAGAINARRATAAAAADEILEVRIAEAGARGTAQAALGRAGGTQSALLRETSRQASREVGRAIQQVEVAQSRIISTSANAASRLNTTSRAIRNIRGPNAANVALEIGSSTFGGLATIQ